MTELGKAGCDTTDVNEIIRFNDDEPGRDDWLAYLTVEQVELHAFLQYFAEIGMVDAVCLNFETNEMFFLISIVVDIHMDEVRVPVFHDAADASVADVESLLVGAVGMWDENGQFMWNISLEYGRDEDGERTGIVLQIFLR